MFDPSAGQRSACSGKALKQLYVQIGIMAHRLHFVYEVAVGGDKKGVRNRSQKFKSTIPKMVEVMKKEKVVGYEDLEVDRKPESSLKWPKFGGGKQKAKVSGDGKGAKQVNVAEARLE